MPETRPPSRFAADVDYSGRAGEHDYVVHVRHRLLDTTFTVTIDGVEHDPKAEEKAQKAAERAENEHSAEAEDPPPDGADGAEDEHSQADGNDSPDTDDAAPDGDDLLFSLQPGFSTLRCIVRRPREDAEHKSSEVITIHTAGLGGAGEVEIRHGFQRTVLVPADGSPSAARDAKRTAHPTRYALLAAATRSVRYLLPLLGIGALLSGLLDPMFAWIEARLRPLVEAIAEATAPVREWIAQLLQPIRDFFAALWQPVRDFVSAVLQPVRDLLNWLLGLLPDIDLPFDLPGWLFDVVIAVIVVAAVFSGTRHQLRERRAKLETTRSTRGEGTGKSKESGEDEEPEAEEATADDRAPADEDPDAEGPNGAPPDVDDATTDQRESSET